MAVVLGKNKGFWNFLSAGEDLRQLLLECPYHMSYLAGIDHVPVQLFSIIGEILVQLFPAFFTGKFLPSVHILLRSYLCPVFANFSFDGVHIITHIHAICHSFFMAVLAHHVLIEKPESAFVRRSCQAYQKSIEIIQNLLPHVVYGAVALVYDHKIKFFNGNLPIIHYRKRFLWLPASLSAGFFPQQDYFPHLFHPAPRPSK